VGHALRSSGLLRVEASRARVSESVLKTSGDATVGGAHDTIMVVASSPSGTQTGRYNGLCGTLVPNFTVFIVLGPKCMLVI
jgi:hypothetical protein